MSLWEKMKCGENRCRHNRHQHGFVNNKKDPYGKGRCRSDNCPCTAFVERETINGSEVSSS